MNIVRYIYIFKAKNLVTKTRDFNVAFKYCVSPACRSCKLFRTETCRPCEAVFLKKRLLFNSRSKMIHKDCANILNLYHSVDILVTNCCCPIVADAELCQLTRSVSQYRYISYQLLLPHSCRC